MVCLHDRGDDVSGHKHSWTANTHITLKPLVKAGWRVLYTVDCFDLYYFDKYLQSQENGMKADVKLKLLQIKIQERITNILGDLKYNST